MGTDELLFNAAHPWKRVAVEGHALHGQEKGVSLSAASKLTPARALGERAPRHMREKRQAERAARAPTSASLSVVCVSCVLSMCASCAAVGRDHMVPVARSWWASGETTAPAPSEPLRQSRELPLPARCTPTSGAACSSGQGSPKECEAALGSPVSPSRPSSLSSALFARPPFPPQRRQMLERSDWKQGGSRQGWT